MTETASVIVSLDNARAAVARAAAAFSAGDDFDLREVERQVDLAAAAATAPQAKSEATARTALINLAADLTDLQNRIRRESLRTADILGRNTVNRRAVAAYGRRG